MTILKLMQVIVHRRDENMKKIVIKCGGSIIDELTPDFFASLKQLQEHGNQLIFVHGGGPDINKMLSMYEVNLNFIMVFVKQQRKHLKLQN